MLCQNSDKAIDRLLARVGVGALPNFLRNPGHTPDFRRNPAVTGRGPPGLPVRCRPGAGCGKRIFPAIEISPQKPLPGPGPGMAGHDRRGSIGVCTTPGEGDPTRTTPRWGPEPGNNRCFCSGRRDNRVPVLPAIVLRGACRRREVGPPGRSHSIARQTARMVHGAPGHKKDISGDTGGIGVRRYGVALPGGPGSRP